MDLTDPTNLLNPANPLSPVSPLNPANPCSVWQQTDSGAGDGAGSLSDGGSGGVEVPASAAYVGVGLFVAFVVVAFILIWRDR